MEGEGDPVAEPMNDPSESEFFRFSIDLFNHGYFWEAHVYLEALWNAHGRTGDVSDFLKGLIKLCAAGVKKDIKQPERVKEHLERARELFLFVRTHQGERFLGFNINTLIQNIETQKFHLDPEWK